MGEIIFSFVIGGCLVLAGIILITASKRESKRELKKLAERLAARTGDVVGEPSPDILDEKGQTQS